MRDLERVYNDPTSTAATKDMVDVIRKMNQNNNDKVQPGFEMKIRDNNQSYRTSRQFKSN